MDKRQKLTIGAIVKIDLGSGEYGYGRILDKSSFAFYDIKTKEDITDLHYIVSKPILFIIAVYDNVVKSGRWLKIGDLPLEEELQVLPLKFIQDKINPNQFEIYNPNTGEMKVAKKEDCLGLECAAVWNGEHVESRLRDHFVGKKNIWVEQMSIK